MTERVLSQVQGKRVEFLSRFHGLTLGDKMRSCEICEALNVDSMFL